MEDGVKFKPPFADKDELLRLAQRYGYEADAEAMAAGARLYRGSPDALSDLKTVYEWKNGGPRNTRHVLKNSSEHVAEAIADAVELAERGRSWHAVCVLTGLEGVNAPVATAILACVLPASFPIYDFRAMEALGVARERQTGSRAEVRAYIEWAIGFADALEVPRRDLDRALWRYSYEMG
jgi:hypothetical protein